MSVDEYLVWSETNPGRCELVRGEAYATTPERVVHAEVTAATYIALRRGIRAAALPCRAMPDGMTVRIDDSTAYEPDALVHCGPRRDANSAEVPDPVIVVEVSSPSTRRTDASEKPTGEFRVPSIHHDLMVDPDRRVVIHHRRAGDGIETAFVQDGRLRLDPPGLELAVTSLFEEP
ncbi:Uma2 family endonuclease [Methylobacterium terricola]|uniref:Uma2 family endonuclease n=2 Tax=Methylobacterium terricola TaxID=2583531 RepID=A0A5C4LLL5_9HYPH|nr:Uma2 family endonuclease [Methylobacterium terricola]